MLAKLRLSIRGRERPDPSAPMTLMEHLTELRNRIIVSLVAVAIGAIAGFFLYDPVLDLLQDPYCEIQEPCDFVVTDPLESFSIRLKVSTYLGLLLASPIVLWNLWRFITPGLYEREKKYAVPFVASGVVLFALGAGLALLTFPQALRFLEGVGGDSIQALYSPGKYLSLILFMMLAFGLGFEFPIVLVFLQIAGVVGWRALSSWRRYAIVLIFIVDAVITPSADPISLLALAVPMVLFYEAAILVGRLAIRKP
jgi:sec-independent protein translocase protein TatC